MKNLPKFPMIMTIAAFECFLLALVFLIPFAIITPYARSMYLLIPAVVLGLITLLYKQYLATLPEKPYWYGPLHEWTGYGRRDEEGTLYIFFLG